MFFFDQPLSVAGGTLRTKMIGTLQISISWFHQISYGKPLYLATRPGGYCGQKEHEQASDMDLKALGMSYLLEVLERTRCVGTL